MKKFPGTEDRKVNREANDRNEYLLQGYFFQYRKYVSEKLQGCEHLSREIKKWRN